MSNERLCPDEIIDREGGVWSYVSPSRLNLWLKCPLAWRLKYLDGEEVSVTPAQFIGRRVHAALEHYYRYRQLGLRVGRQELVRTIRVTWSEAVDREHVPFTDAADELACRRQTENLALCYWNQMPPDEPQPLVVETAMEARLVDPSTGEDLGLPLVGVLDLVLDEPDGPLIVDFKTASRGGDMTEILHEVQLSSYAYLFRSMAHRAEGSLEIRNLIKTKTPRIETHRFAARSESSFGRLFAVIRAYLDDLDAGRFIYRPSFGCGACGFRETHCRSWAG